MTFNDWYQYVNGKFMLNMASSRNRTVNLYIGGKPVKGNLYCYRFSKCFNLDAQIIICFYKIFNYKKKG